MPAKSNTSPLADELLIDAEPMEPRALHRGREALWLLLALILVAINLRPALSSLAPVLRQVQTSLDLNSTAAGMYQPTPAELGEMQAFGEFVEAVRQWGRAERAKLGL